MTKDKPLSLEELKKFVEKWVQIIRPETPTSIRLALKDLLKEYDKLKELKGEE